MPPLFVDLKLLILSRFCITPGRAACESTFTSLKGGDHVLVSVKTWAEAPELLKQGFEFRSMTYWVGTPNTTTYTLQKDQLRIGEVLPLCTG